MLAAVTDDARLNLAGRVLTIHRADGSEKTLLDDAATVVSTLRERFGIDVPDPAGLEARVDVLLARQPGTDSA